MNAETIKVQLITPLSKYCFGLPPKVEVTENATEFLITWKNKVTVSISKDELALHDLKNQPYGFFDRVAFRLSVGIFKELIPSTERYTPEELKTLVIEAATK